MGNPSMPPWLSTIVENLFANWAADILSPTSVSTVALVIVCGIVWAIFWHRRQKASGKLGVQTWHILLAGILGTWIFVSLTFAAAARMVWGGKGLGLDSAKIDSLQADFDKYVKPRQLTDEQKKAIINFLLPRGPRTIQIGFSPFDQEATEYAAQWLNALHEANWDVSMKSTDNNGKFPPDGYPPGIGLNIRTILGANFKGGVSKTQDLILQAIRIAKIETLGSSQNQGSQAEDETILIVGHRPLVINVSKDKAN